MMVDVIPIPVLSILVGVLGLSLAAYTRYEKSQEKMRTKRLKELSDKLDDIRSRLERLQSLKEPYSHPDSAHALEAFSDALVAHEFETAELPQVIVTPRVDDSEVENSDQALRVYKEKYTYVRVLISISSGNRPSYDINHHIFYLGTAYQTLDEIREDYIDIIEEFSPGLLSDIESSIDELIRNCYGQVIKGRNGFTIDIHEYESTDKIGEHVFEGVWYYDGIEDDLAEIDEKVEEVEEVRTAILQASYT